VETVGSEGVADVDSVEAADGTDNGESQSGGAFDAVGALMEAVEEVGGIERGGGACTPGA